MFAFAWVVTALLLLLLAQLMLVLPTASRTYWRERRWAPHRPRWRAVLLLTAIELAIVIAWGVFVVVDPR